MSFNRFHVDKLSSAHVYLRLHPVGFHKDPSIYSLFSFSKAHILFYVRENL